MLNYQRQQQEHQIQPQWNVSGSIASLPMVPVHGVSPIHPLLNDYIPGIAAVYFEQTPTTPNAPNYNKGWHVDVAHDLRHHMVGKIVKAIFPCPNPAALHDPRIKDLYQYAKKVEREMFEAADDITDYCHLVAEKIYKIQVELQRKKQQRLNSGNGCISNSANGMSMTLGQISGGPIQSGTHNLQSGMYCWGQDLNTGVIIPPAGGVHKQLT